MVTEIQVKQIRMSKEQEKQGRILRNLQKFLMDNQANPILIEEESSSDHTQEDSEEEPMEEEEAPLEEEDAPVHEVQVEDDDTVVCVGEVCFDKDGNLVEQRGNFCLHYPNCSIQRSLIVKNNP